MILNELKPRKVLNKDFLRHYQSTKPNRPIGLPALWVDGGGDWDCGEGVSGGAKVSIMETGAEKIVQ